jgi:TatD DNase family protein
VARERGGVFHCFTGSRALAEAALARGFLLSFSGIVTFRSAAELQEIAASLPPDRFLIETDCPYLAPIPHRGRRNEPSFVRETAAFLAQLRGVPIEELIATTAENFRRLFRPPSQ